MMRVALFSLAVALGGIASAFQLPVHARASLHQRRSSATIRYAAASAASAVDATPIDVLVVGGGPAGLATATELATIGLNVTVIERRPAPGTFESQRAYLCVSW